MVGGAGGETDLFADGGAITVNARTELNGASPDGETDQTGHLCRRAQPVLHLLSVFSTAEHDHAHSASAARAGLVGDFLGVHGGFDSLELPDIRLDAEVLKQDDWATVLGSVPEDPGTFSAYLHTITWNTASAADGVTSPKACCHAAEARGVSAIPFARIYVAAMRAPSVE